MKKKKLVLSLIKDDMINTKLVLGLYDAGLDAGNYFLNLSTTIFSLMGYSKKEREGEIYEMYREIVMKVKQLEISNSSEEINGLANSAYNLLRF